MASGHRFSFQPGVGRVWLAYDLAVPLDLEASYEETCAALRYP